MPWALGNNYGFRRPCKACQSETRDQKLKLNEDDVHITLLSLQSKSKYISRNAVSYLVKQNSRQNSSKNYKKFMYTKLPS